MIFTILQHAHQITRQLLILLADGNLISLAFALLVFWFIGEKAVADSGRLRSAGLQAGVVAFLGFIVWTWQTSGIHSGGALSSAAVRSVLCAGFVTSLAWLLLAIAAFLYQHTLSVAAQILDHRRHR